MMPNLFSSFDPVTIYSLSLNWSSSMILFFLIPLLYWTSPSRWISTWLTITLLIHKEFKVLIKTPIYLGSTLIFYNLMIYILFNNFMGLFPYVFTNTSHLNFTLYMSLPFWLSFMLFGWIKNTTHMLAHLVPQGAPNPLMPFLVVIETISNLIRPGTLAIRLTANMIAGHLLITLLSNSSSKIELVLISLMIIPQIALLILESAVAMIQSYVFSILMTLYSEEIN
uniref:ATP synthase subunit a n=1 Tax=Trigonopterus singkawangensis TaxID=1729343 RepID=A0A7H1KHZ6_9CUCU|nr:ATP synthase F0 subunit 6 [Trigonopterus singkawangensis]QNT26912.1 ATP synthase F0 subunit 6 [Trigonopterus singkawangensis]